jgi:serine/threonine protein kinase
MAASSGYMEIGEYRIMQKLGSGSFAQVFKATYMPDGSPRAVKAIQLARLSPKLLKGLEAEITILRQVEHRNIGEP